MFRVMMVFFLLFPQGLFASIFQEEVRSLSYERFMNPLDYLRSGYYTYYLTGDEIESFYTLDLPSVLSRIPGVEVLRRNGGQDMVSIDGSRYIAELWTVDRVLLTVNGFPIAQETNFTPWSLLPFDVHDVKKVEVIRGGGSYIGSNAFLGIINLELKDPGEMGRKVILEGGDHGNYREKLIWNWSWEGGNLGVSLSQEGMGSIDENDYNPFKRLFFNYQEKLGNLYLKGWGGVADGLIKRPLIIHPTMSGTTFYFNNMAIYGSTKFTFEYQQFIGHSKIPDVYRVLSYAFYQNPDVYSIKYKILRTSLEKSFSRSILSILFGCDLKRTFSFAEDFIPSNTYYIYGLYTQGTLTLSKNVDLSFGLRWEKHEEIGSSLSYRLGLSWTISSKKELYLLLSSGFRNPNSLVLYANRPVKGFMNLGSFYIPFSVRVKGNRDIDPEKVTSFEATFVYRPNQGSEFSLSFFWHAFRDVIEVKKHFSFPSFTLRFENRHDADVFGLRGLLNLDAGSWGRFRFYGALQKVKLGGRYTNGAPSADAGFSWIRDWDRLSSSFSLKVSDGVGEPYSSCGTRFIGETKLYYKLGEGRKIGISVFNLLNNRASEYYPTLRVKRTVKFFVDWCF